LAFDTKRIEEAFERRLPIPPILGVEKMDYRNTFPIGIIMMAAALAGLMATSNTPTRAGDKEFRPTIEADMPEDFPSWTPVGEVRIKEYPAYRKAEADASRGRAFWSLFMHIKQNGVAMTAPVEMTYDDHQASREGRMAFLYGKADMGRIGTQGKVRVVDVPAIVVVSTGVRGARTEESIAKAQARVGTWLVDNRDRYSAAGPLRVMAYNSPFVPRDQNYFEVEIPIHQVVGDDSSAGHAE
jgi:SOUL heme-binding protein